MRQRLQYSDYRIVNGVDNEAVPWAAVAQFGDTITIAVNPPYTKDLPIVLNEFRIPEKERFGNEDLGKILGVHPTTIQWRCDRNKYGPINKDAAGRRYFTLDDLRRIVAQENQLKGSS